MAELLVGLEITKSTLFLEAMILLSSDLGDELIDGPRGDLGVTLNVKEASVDVEELLLQFSQTAERIGATGTFLRWRQPAILIDSCFWHFGTIRLCKLRLQDNLAILFPFSLQEFCYFMLDGFVCLYGDTSHFRMEHLLTEQLERRLDSDFVIYCHTIFDVYHDIN